MSWQKKSSQIYQNNVKADLTSLDPLAVTTQLLLTVQAPPRIPLLPAVYTHPRATSDLFLW